MSFMPRSMGCALWLCLLVSATTVTATDPIRDNQNGTRLALQKSSSEDGRAGRSPQPVVPAASESASEDRVLDFAKREEPQLYELLKFLKKKRPSAYQQAIDETGRTQQRLENLQQRDPELFEVERQLWKTRSRLSLIAAQLSVAEDEKLEMQLNELVGELDKLELAKIELMRDRAAKQLEKWDSQWKARSADPQGNIEKCLESWKSRIKKQRNSQKKLK